MDGGGKRAFGVRARLLGATAVVAAMTALSGWLLLTSSAASAGSSGGTALLPDLVVEPPSEIVLQGAPGEQTFLRFSHTTANTGQGPLELNPNEADDDCADRGDRAKVAYQSIYQDSNSDEVFQRGVDTETTQAPVGCMIFHEVHDHYHFEDFAQYELYRVKSGLRKETSDKVSFCVVDILEPYPDLPGSPEVPHYSYSNCLSEEGIHGISVGWADIYGSGTPGQEFDVTDRNPGRYCLVALTDPEDRIDEISTGGEDNNIQTVQIKMNPKRATEFGKPVTQLDEPCSPPVR